jgi:hypothetical protein
VSTLKHLKNCTRFAVDAFACSACGQILWCSHKSCPCCLRKGTVVLAVPDPVWEYDCAKGCDGFKAAQP